VNRTVLITGASSGFGLLTSITLAKRGWRVLATMRDCGRREKLESAAREADGVPMRALYAAAPIVAVPDTGGWGQDCDTWDELARARAGRGGGTDA